MLKRRAEGSLPLPDASEFSVEYERYQRLIATNEQLMIKNREYLQRLSERSGLSAENERLKAELKNLMTTVSQINSQYNHFRKEQETNSSLLLERLTAAEVKNEK